MKISTTAQQLLGVFFLTTELARGQTALDKYPVVDGTVYSMVSTADTIYIAGTFTQVARYTGSGVQLDAETGLYDPELPSVNGSVFAAIPDGSAGWYVGGSLHKSELTPDEILSIFEPTRPSIRHGIRVRTTMFRLLLYEKTPYTLAGASGWSGARVEPDWLLWTHQQGRSPHGIREQWPE